MLWRSVLAFALAVCSQAESETDTNALSSDDECATGTNSCSLELLQRSATPNQSREEVLGAKPTITCQTVLERMDKASNWKLVFYAADLNVSESDDIQYVKLDWDTWEEAKFYFRNRHFPMISAYRQDVDDPCGARSKRSVWFYPVADHNGAFNLDSDFICSRMAVATELNHLDCIDVFRVSTVHEIEMVLDRFVSSHTIVDAVLGGHGDDEVGVLQLGNEKVIEDFVTNLPVTSRMLRKLGNQMVENGVIFLDSCYSGKNGLAEFVSDHIPHAWVMGGIVSLDTYIDMLPGKNGPSYVMSDFPAADPKVPSFEGGTQAIEVFAQGKDLGSASKYGAPEKDPNPDRWWW